jgi:hypothetical protein
VVQRTAPEVYLDPEEFFRKTYMTEGLGSVLARISKALSGDADSGDRIISLQTAFGGGKTHTLVALWHLAKHAGRLKKSPHGKEIRRFLGKKFPDQIKAVAVFTNASCDATQGRQTPEGIHTHTLWGELALQLGGKKLYEKVRANDETQRVPQGLFVDVLREASPCLILLDELADYCVGAAAVPVGDTTLADQTISFIQQLEEAVAQVPGSAIVATLPASKYEVAQSEKGQEAFMTLEKRFQRLGADVKPVAAYDVNGFGFCDRHTDPGFASKNKTARCFFAGQQPDMGNLSHPFFPEHILYDCHPISVSRGADERGFHVPQHDPDAILLHHRNERPHCEHGHDDFWNHAPECGPLRFDCRKGGDVGISCAERPVSVSVHSGIPFRLPEISQNRLDEQQFLIQ